MSVDIEATMPKPVTLAAVIGQGQRVLSDLLGGTAVPDMAIFVDRQYQQGVRTAPGRRLDSAELATTLIGDPIAPDANGLPGSVHFEIDLPATGDGVWLKVIDFHHWELGEVSSCRHAVFSPYRTCVGVALATGLELATAQLADGEYVDEEIEMLTPLVREPDQVISGTRLPHQGGTDFAAQCETYLRQFPGLQRWPRVRSMSSPDQDAEVTR